MYIYIVNKQKISCYRSYTIIIMLSSGDQVLSPELYGYDW